MTLLFIINKYNYEIQVRVWPTTQSKCTTEVWVCTCNTLQSDIAMCKQNFPHIPVNPTIATSFTDKEVGIQNHHQMKM